MKKKHEFVSAMTALKSSYHNKLKHERIKQFVMFQENNSEHFEAQRQQVTPFEAPFSWMELMVPSDQ
jgi:hypothetical protein